MDGLRTSCAAKRQRSQQSIKSSDSGYKSTTEGMTYRLKMRINIKSSAGGYKSAMEGRTYCLEKRTHGKRSAGGYKSAMEGMAYLLEEQKRFRWGLQERNERDDVHPGGTERVEMAITRARWKECHTSWRNGKNSDCGYKSAIEGMTY